MDNLVVEPIDVQQELSAMDAEDIMLGMSNSNNNNSGSTEGDEGGNDGTNSEVSLVDEELEFGDEMALGPVEEDSELQQRLASENDRVASVEEDNYGGEQLSSSPALLVKQDSPISKATKLENQHREHEVNHWKQAVADALETRTLESRVRELLASTPKGLTSQDFPPLDSIRELVEEVDDYVQHYHSDFPSLHFTRRRGSLAVTSNTNNTVSDTRHKVTVQDLQNLLARGRNLEERLLLDVSMVESSAISNHLDLVSTWESGVPNLLQSVAANVVIKPAMLDKIEDALSTGNSLGIQLETLTKLVARLDLHRWAMEIDATFKDSVGEELDDKVRLMSFTHVEQLVERAKAASELDVDIGKRRTVISGSLTKLYEITANELNMLTDLVSPKPDPSRNILPEIWLDQVGKLSQGCWFPFRDVVQLVSSIVRWALQSETLIEDIIESLRDVNELDDDIPQLSKEKSLSATFLSNLKVSTITQQLAQQLEASLRALETQSTLLHLTSIEKWEGKIQRIALPVLEHLVPNLIGTMANVKSLLKTVQFLLQKLNRKESSDSHLSQNQLILNYGLAQHVLVTAALSPVRGYSKPTSDMTNVVRDREDLKKRLIAWRQGLVGTSVKVDWDGEWYKAKVIEYVDEEDHHGIVYEDGSPETLRMNPGGIAFSPDGTDAVDWTSMDQPVQISQKVIERARKTIRHEPVSDSSSEDKNSDDYSDSSSDDDNITVSELARAMNTGSRVNRKRKIGKQSKTISSQKSTENASEVKKAASPAKRNLKTTTSSSKVNNATSVKSTRSEKKKPKQQRKVKDVQNRKKRPRVESENSKFSLQLVNDFIEIQNGTESSWDLCRVFKYDFHLDCNWVVYQNGSVELIHLFKSGIAQSPDKSVSSQWRTTRRAFDPESDFTSGSDSDAAISLPTDTLNGGRIKLGTTIAKQLLSQVRLLRQHSNKPNLKLIKPVGKRQVSVEFAVDENAANAVPIIKPSRTPRKSFIEQEAELTLLHWCQRRFDDLLLTYREKIIRNVVKKRSAAQSRSNEDEDTRNPVRLRVKKSFIDLFEKTTSEFAQDFEKGNSDSVGSGFETMCRKLESALHQVFPFEHETSTGKENKRLYIGQSRSLCFNLEKNPALRLSLLKGEIDMHTLCRMKTQDMANEDLKSKREQSRQELDQEILIRSTIQPEPLQSRKVMEPKPPKERPEQLSKTSVAIDTPNTDTSKPKQNTLGNLKTANESKIGVDDNFTTAISSTNIEAEIEDSDDELPDVGAFGATHEDEDVVMQVAEQPLGLPDPNSGVKWLGTLRGVPNILAHVEFSVKPDSAVAGGRLHTVLDLTYLLHQLPLTVDLRGKIRLPRAQKFLEEVGIHSSRRQLVIANVRPRGPDSEAQLKTYADELVKHQRAGVIDENKVLVYLYAAGTGPELVERHALAGGLLNACIVAKPADFADRPSVKLVPA